MEPEIPPEHASFPTDLTPCKCCGRRFNPDTLAKHESICIKSRQKDASRKPFDSAMHRAMGTELESYSIQKKYNKSGEDRLKMIAYERQAQKKKLWKRKHEEFVNAIRSAREYELAAKTGTAVPPLEPSVPNPDYVQCPYCKRRFQEHAAERHIPFCKEQSSRIDHRNPNNSTVTSAWNKRLKYKPPSIRKRTETEGRSENHRPPGSSLIPKKTNFQATYTVSENSSGSDYQGERRMNGLAGPRTYNMANKPFSGKHHYDANQQGQFKPHPPSKLPLPPNRLAHGIRRADMKVGNQRRLSNGYQSSSDEQGDSSAFSRKHHSVGHFIRKQSEETEGQYSSSSRVSLPKIDQHRDKVSNGQSITGQPQQQERVSSNSSQGMRSANSGMHSQLNIHGMTMSKFCYECGSGFPVPQAKYCCECGTKRI